MSWAYIENYSMGVDLSSYGLPEQDKDKIPYEVFWDGPIHHPNNPDFWKVQRKDLLKCIATFRKQGIIPIVAVFVPKK